MIERARQRAEKAKVSMNSRYSLPASIAPGTLNIPGSAVPFGGGPVGGAGVGGLGGMSGAVGGLRQRRLMSMQQGGAGHGVASAMSLDTTTITPPQVEVTTSGESASDASTTSGAPASVGGAPPAVESQWESRMRAMKERQEARRKQQDQLNKLKGADSLPAALGPGDLAAAASAAATADTSTTTTTGPSPTPSRAKTEETLKVPEASKRKRSMLMLWNTLSGGNNNNTTNSSKEEDKDKKEKKKEKEKEKDKKDKDGSAKKTTNRKKFGSFIGGRSKQRDEIRASTFTAFTPAPEPTVVAPPITSSTPPPVARKTRKEMRSRSVTFSRFGLLAYTPLHCTTQHNKIHHPPKFYFCTIRNMVQTALREQEAEAAKELQLAQQAQRAQQTSEQLKEAPKPSLPPLPQVRPAHGVRFRGWRPQSVEFTPATVEKALFDMK